MLDHALMVDMGNLADAIRTFELVEQGRAYGIDSLYDAAAEYYLDGEPEIARVYLDAAGVLLTERAYQG